MLLVVVLLLFIISFILIFIINFVKMVVIIVWFVMKVSGLEKCKKIEVKLIVIIV